MKKLFALLFVFLFAASAYAQYDASSYDETFGDIYCRIIKPLTASCEGNIALPHVIAGTTREYLTTEGILGFNLDGQASRDVIVTLNGPVAKEDESHLGSFGGTVTLVGTWKNGANTIVSGATLPLSTTGALAIDYKCDKIITTAGARGTYTFVLDISAHYDGF